MYLNQLTLLFMPCVHININLVIKIQCIRVTDLLVFAMQVASEGWILGVAQDPFLLKNHFAMVLRTAFWTAHHDMKWECTNVTIPQMLASDARVCWCLF